MEKQEIVKAIINQAEGRFCSVQFIKKDGTVRTLTVQPAAAKKHVRGDLATPSAQQAVKTRAVQNPHLVNVWDVSDQKFKCFNVNKLLTIKVDGAVHNFVPVR